jgi:hypothetical protein
MERLTLCLKPEKLALEACLEAEGEIIADTETSM